MNYVKLHTDALLAYKRLSDTEFGRAVRAVLQYVEDGTEPNLPGKESIMFDVLREQVERDRKSYNKKVDAQRENGSKGGRPRKNQKPNETHGFLENPTKPNETQEKEKEKELSSVGFFADDDDAIGIAAQHSEIFRRMEQFGVSMTGVLMESLIRISAENGLEETLSTLGTPMERAQEHDFCITVSLLDDLTKACNKYGDEVVIAALDDCGKHGARTLAYLRKVLENKNTPTPPAPDKPRDYASDYVYL